MWQADALRGLPLPERRNASKPLEPPCGGPLYRSRGGRPETRLTDGVLTVFCKYMGSLFTKAWGHEERRFEATKRDVARTLLLFRRASTALKQAKKTGEESVAAVEPRSEWPSSTKPCR